VAGVDEFDETCRKHDASYANYHDNPTLLTKADKLFYKQNMGKGPKRTIAAMAILSNRIGRSGDTPNLRGKSTVLPVVKAKGLGPLDLLHSIKNNNKSTDLYQRNPKFIIKMPNLRGSKNKYKANNTLTKAPVATSRTVRLQKPRVGARGNATTVTHREYVRAVTGSTGTKVVSVPVNPGLQGSFSWLSSIAVNYERYEFTKLSYVYVSAAATSERGRVALAYQYDPTNNSAYTRAEFFSVIPNVEEAPWEDMELNVKPVSEKRFVREGTLTSGTLNTYDAGKLLIMTAMNADSTTQLGELFVEYSVTLYNPQFAQLGCGETTIIGPSASIPFGTGISVFAGNPTMTWDDGANLFLGSTSPKLYVVKFTGTGLAQTLSMTTTSGSPASISIKTSTVNAAGTEQVIVASIKGGMVGDTLKSSGAVSTTITGVIIYSSMYISQV
jgi:hypothetical protein